MQTIIRTNASNSEESTPVNNSIHIDLQQKAKIIPKTKFSDTIDLYDLFLKEREACDNYRLIVTINPVLTNVLFNMNTEIVYKEGATDSSMIDDHFDIVEKIGTLHDEETGEELVIYGDETPDRIKMVQNTEYSRKSFPFTYHCGYDIFNNHLLRSTSFKCVNMPEENGVNTDFNTIRDFMRYNNGKIVKYNKRASVEDMPELDLDKHLYDYEDIMPMTDAINARLIEENGWFGFTNGMKINTRIVGDVVNDSIYHETMDINRPINSRSACDFVDMYPDRTLFSFNPKVNTYQKRLEYNWKYCITYPWKSTTNHPLIFGNGVNGLKANYVVKSIGLNGSSKYLFRMLLPHNLTANEQFFLYIDGVKMASPLTVAAVGDLQGEETEHVFYVSGDEIAEELGLEPDITREELDSFNEQINGHEFRIRRLVGDFESSYYIRIFRKLPNFRYEKELPTDDTIEEITEDLYANKRTEFENYLYPLGFQSTIYNDKSTQITFTDNISVPVLKDNLGRPLSEVFFTIIKNNAGWNSWYGITEEGIEASGCELSLGSYNPNVSNEGMTVRIPVYAKTNIGEPIEWTSSDGQSGTNGEPWVMVVPRCDKTVDEGGCTYEYTINAVTDKVSCSASATITLKQPGREVVEEPCTDCTPFVHTPANYDSLDHTARRITFYVYHSCFDGTPYPWRAWLVDKETQTTPTWATISSASGSGYCCEGFSACKFSQEAKDACTGVTPDRFYIDVAENTTLDMRSLDFYIASVGACQMQTYGTLNQSGNPNADNCPLKYAAFRDSRTINNYSESGGTLTEYLNIYCEVGDVDPTFTIEGADGVSYSGADEKWDFQIPALPDGVESRTITITVHPNKEEAQASASTTSYSVEFPVIRKEGTKTYMNGELYSDFDEELDEIGTQDSNDTNNKSKSIPIVTNSKAKEEKKERIHFQKKARSTEPLSEEAMSAIEFSHCFGKITSGFKILDRMSVPKNNVQTREIDVTDSDVTLLHNTTTHMNPTANPLEEDITLDGKNATKKCSVIEESGDEELIEAWGKYKDDIFLGDVVEFNTLDAKEAVLEDVYHRFNTTQREYEEFPESSTLAQFHWDEIRSDDYDMDGFSVSAMTTGYDEKSNIRPEGYYYKPHYRIPIREIQDTVDQESMFTIIPRSMQPLQGNMVEITASQKHHLLEGETLHVVELDENGDDKQEYLCSVYALRNELIFVLNINGTGLSFPTLSSGLANNTMEIRKENPDIPSYAFPLKDGTGTYVWRNVNRIGNLRNVELLENDYPFTNNAFYYHKNINFYLRRQDPRKEKGLYNDDKYPNDVMGVRPPENNTAYIREEDIPC